MFQLGSKEEELKKWGGGAEVVECVCACASPDRGVLVQRFP